LVRRTPETGPNDAVDKRNTRMFAVIKTGGKQYKVAKDEIFTVEKLTAAAGETVQFNDVLMLGGDKIVVGAPMVADAGVQAEILEQKLGEKTIHFVKRRRKHSSQRKKGHRQQLTVIKITDILAKGAGKSGVQAAMGGTSAVAVEAAQAKPKAAKVAAKPAKKADAKPATEAKAKKPAAEATTGAAPSNLLKAAKGDADDLKKISGVGPALEKKVNAIGVYHFWQIAEWNAEDIAYMDDSLSFKGRIERDDWIKQAKEFAAEAK